MHSYTISILGEVSSGKSSLVNAFCGGFVSSCSLHRETLCPIGITLRENANYDNIRLVTNQIEKIKSLNISTKEIQYVNSAGEALRSPEGLGNLVLIDLPGTNDSSDSDGSYVISSEIFQNIIHCSDLVIFCTDANSAFLKSSEVEVFNQVRKMVSKENDKGKYTELILVVNKFDSPYDKELNDIYQKIPTTLGFDPSKIFKFSSHQFLIEMARSQKLVIPVPDIMKNELQKILKNTQVNITEELAKFLKEQQLLKGEHIVYQDNTINDLFFGNQVSGDRSSAKAQDLMQWLQTFQRKLDECRIVTCQQRIIKIIDLLTLNVLDKDTNYFSKDVCAKVFDELNQLTKRSEIIYPSYFHYDLTQKIITIITNIMTNKHSRKNAFILKSLHFNLKYFLDLIQHIQYPVDIDSIEKDNGHAYHTLLLLNLGGNQKYSIYRAMIRYGYREKNYQWTFYDHRSNKFLSGHECNDTSITDNIYLQYLMTFHPDPDLQAIIEISYIPIRYLRLMYIESKLIPRRWLELFEIDTSYYLHLIIEGDANECLGSKLFFKSKFPKSYQNYFTKIRNGFQNFSII